METLELKRSQAVQLIHRLICAEVEVVKSFQNPGGPSKKKVKAERTAAQALYKALVGESATDDQINAMCDY